MSLRSLFVSSAVATGLAMIAASPAFADAPPPVTVTYENPGVENSTLPFAFGSLVETFDGLAKQVYSTVATTVGTYTNLDVTLNDQYGGAGGAGNYPTVFSGNSYALTLVQPVAYFGLWFSAQDTNNQLVFKNNGNVVFTFNGDQMRSDLSGNGAYFGNPDAPYAGQNQYEPYAFINFTAASGVTFDEIDFVQNGAWGGLETDNHTIASIAAACPEPAVWALMMVGIGGMGAALRVRRRRAPVAG